MAVYKIALAQGRQSFRVSLGGVVYGMRLIWIDADQGTWLLDIADSSGNPMVSGIPLVPGVDLLAQYKYLGFGGELYVQRDDDASAAPTYGDLGTLANLYFVTP